MGKWRRGPGQSDQYEGEYRNDKKEGFGVFSWADGNVYRGNYVNDLREGYGEMFWVDGIVYKGQWKEGNQVAEIDI